ncbi:hypothetical protein BB559_004344 [Furculomyces boomerangus]|uniref:Coatomer subunit delta n=1 Tax=Furculomyces boomerangus TaxID=61424 RepID=A0A2T9YFI4_9FUNG|nr:hypothetical protein BB559_004344 [Furculomyces boomerangus]
MDLQKGFLDFVKKAVKAYKLLEDEFFSCLDWLELLQLGISSTHLHSGANVLECGCCREFYFFGEFALVLLLQKPSLIVDLGIEDGSQLIRKYIDCVVIPITRTFNNEKQEIMISNDLEFPKIILQKIDHILISPERGGNYSKENSSVDSNTGWYGAYILYLELKPKNPFEDIHEEINLTLLNKECRIIDEDTIGRILGYPGTLPTTVHPSYNEQRTNIDGSLIDETQEIVIVSYLCRFEDSRIYTVTSFAILATSICTKTGKPLVSRQTVGMTRGHIEGLLSSFPKLIVEGQQHTTVETESVRYVFQPLSDDMYLVLVTSKSSNIVQDVDTLQLVARAIPEVCPYISQDEIIENAFQLMSVFDEITSLGYSKEFSINTLKAIIEMDSHEEKIQAIIDRNKEKEAKQELKRKAKVFEMQRKQAASSGSKGNMPSFGGIGSYERVSTSNDQDVYVEKEQTSLKSSYVSKAVPTEPTTRGMKLGRKPKDADMFGSLGHEISAVQTGIQKMSVSAAQPDPTIDQKSL